MSACDASDYDYHLMHMCYCVMHESYIAHLSQHACNDIITFIRITLGGLFVRLQDRVSQMTLEENLQYYLNLFSHHEANAS